MTRSRELTIFVLALILNLLLASSSPAASPRQVNDAIDKAVKYLYSQQKNGNWEHVKGDRARGQQGGMSAIATYALLAAGGSGDFKLSAENTLCSIFNAKPADIAVLPETHAVYSAAGKIEEVEYRAYAKKVLGNIHKSRLRGLDIKGRTAVFLSDEDLSAGLVGNPVDGIVGYNPSPMKVNNKTRAGASEIMAGILLQSAGKAPPAEVKTKDPPKNPAPAKQPGKGKKK